MKNASRDMRQMRNSGYSSPGHKEILLEIVQDIAYVSFFTYCFLFALETIKSGLVSDYVDLDIILIIAVISCLLFLALRVSPTQAASKIDYLPYRPFLVAISMVLIVILIALTRFRGLGAATAVLIICLTFFVTLIAFSSN